MEPSPSPETKIQYQFEAFCKKVIWGERCDYLRELLRRTDRESAYSDLPLALLDKLCADNSDPAEQYIFDIYGYTVPIQNDRLAEYLLDLGIEGYSILLLSYSLGMSDSEIGLLLGRSRSRIQQIRSELFSELQKRMKE